VGLVRADVPLSARGAATIIEPRLGDEGAIVYVFKALRSTTGRTSPALAPRPVWSSRKSVPPLTGNSASTNLLLGALNGFNLKVSAAAVAGGVTVERVFDGERARALIDAARDRRKG